LLSSSLSPFGHGQHEPVLGLQKLTFDGHLTSSRSSAFSCLALELASVYLQVLVLFQRIGPSSPSCTAHGHILHLSHLRPPRVRLHQNLHRIVIAHNPSGILAFDSDAHSLYSQKSESALYQRLDRLLRNLVFS
jgi:hypothetical protein